MKVILTSTGFEDKETLEKIKKAVGSFGKTKMLVIPIARKYEYNKEKYLNDYMSLGFKKENVCFFDDENPSKYRNLDIDLLYVCGGNTFLLKKLLKESDFEKDIMEYVKKGVIYLGASAGTHIATSSIRHILYFDDNNVNVKDFTGLNLYHGIIICHYDGSRKNIYDELKKKKYKVETLTNSEVLEYKNNTWIKY